MDVDGQTGLFPLLGALAKTALARTCAVSGPEEERRYHARDKSLQRPPKDEAGDEGQDAKHHGDEKEEGAHQPSEGERRVAAIAAAYRNRAR
jgi:hypothetical protein